MPDAEGDTRGCWDNVEQAVPPSADVSSEYHQPEFDLASYLGSAQLDRGYGDHSAFSIQPDDNQSMNDRLESPMSGPTVQQLQRVADCYSHPSCPDSQRGFSASAERSLAGRIEPERPDAVSSFDGEQATLADRIKRRQRPRPSDTTLPSQTNTAAIRVSPIQTTAASEARVFSDRTPQTTPGRSKTNTQSGSVLASEEREPIKKPVKRRKALRYGVIRTSKRGPRDR